MELREIAVMLEEAAEALGWDQPAMLWVIDGGEARMHALLDGHPAEALIGEYYQGDGCAVVTEGWSHTEARMRLLRAGVELDQPSTYKDAVEVRNCCVVMRDGREMLTQRTRGGELAVIDVEGSRLGGRVVEAQRRVLGVPSLARCDAGVAQMRERVKLTMLGVLMEGINRPGADAARVLGGVLRGWLTVLGLYEEEWERARLVALESARSGTLGEELMEFLNWADGAMWGDRLDRTHPLVEEARELIEARHGGGEWIEALLRELG